MLAYTAIALLLAVTEPAGGPVAAPAKTAAELDKEVVCVNVTPTGSSIIQRVCKTRKTWRKLEDRQKRQADQALDPSSQNTRARD